MIKKIAIIGGGAAGLAAACSLNPAFDVTVYERNERVGKKLLATGNGRCNLANTDLSTARFSSKNIAEMTEILNSRSFEDIRLFFEKLGLLIRYEEDGRVYPLSNQATAVLDVLRYSAIRHNVRLSCDFCVKNIVKNDDMFEITSSDNQREYADAVILATGGKASPKTGSDGIGYSLAKAFGHSLIGLSPVLVPLKSDTSFTLPLKGIRAKAKVTLNDTVTESGEIQFTDYGISGIAAMQLSRHLSGQDNISIDFTEDYTEEHILSLLRKSKEKNPPLGELFLGILNRRIGEEIIKRTLKLAVTLSSSKITDNDLIKLAKTVKGLELPVTGTLSWDNAQVTSGGIPLSEIDSDAMESKLCKNLYITGEMLDCDGECGGYNLSFAWITAFKAASALNQYFGETK